MRVKTPPGSMSAVYLIICLLGSFAAADNSPSSFSSDMITDEDMAGCSVLFDEALPDVAADGDKWTELKGGMPAGMRVWGQLVEGTGSLTFRVAGTMNVPVEALVQTVESVDFEERKAWDTSCMRLDKLAAQGNNDICIWLVDFPWPMSDREYVYRRRLDRLSDGSAISISRIVNGSEHYLTADPNNVRIMDYVQYSAARPLPDGSGSSFHMLYRNDMRAPLPQWLVTWFSKTALPAFLAKVVSVSSAKAATIKPVV